MHWKVEQQERLLQLMNDGVQIAYYNTDAHGFPCNNKPPNGYWDLMWKAEPGKIQKVSGPLKICSANALHATLEPHLWMGSRVWMVAMHGEIQWAEDKCASLKREILGEILPHETFCPKVGIRIGRKDLSGAKLYRAKLSRANLSEANLSGANLSGADLPGANLNEVNFSGAYRPEDDIPGWEAVNGFLKKKNN